MYNKRYWHRNAGWAYGAIASSHSSTRDIYKDPRCLKEVKIYKNPQTQYFLIQEEKEAGSINLVHTLQLNIHSVTMLLSKLAILFSLLNLTMRLFFITKRSNQYAYQCGINGQWCCQEGQAVWNIRFAPTLSGKSTSCSAY